MRRLTILTVVVSMLVVPAARAGLPPCTGAIAKAVEKYMKGKRKAIAGCEDKRSKGTLAPTVNCRPAAGAVTDTPTLNKLSNLASKVQPSIDAKCTGPLPPLGPACDSAVTNAALAACITATTQDADIDFTNADTLIATEYGPTTQAPVTNVGLQACQAAISKEGGKYLASRMKNHRKCATSRANGKVAACPDAKAGAAFTKARVKLDAGIRKKCTEAQLAANSAPKLDFGVPCELYKLADYVRDPNPPMTANVRPVLDRFIECIADAHAAAGDLLAGIALVNPEASQFTQGVAAGDATDSTAIFWTRLPDSTTGALLDVSTDATFTTGVQTIGVSSALGDDGVVKEDVGSLLPKTTYHYRFRQGAQTSATGHVTTTPLPGDTTRIVRLGWSGDSNAFYRPYNSLDPIRLLAPDAWFYIGDTIYGDDPQADGVVAMTQDEYDAKYRLNRTDASLRFMMEATGTYSQWDDHEVRNDFAGAEPVFATKMAAGNASFRRYMPLRDDTGDPMQLYRSFQWGSGAEFFLIDDRQYRSAKYTCCNTATESGFVTTDDDSTCTGGMAGEATIPDDMPPDNCITTMSNPARTILGATQKAWLKTELQNSTATFKFIINGPPITELLFLPYDRWEAWIAERKEILDFIEDPNGDTNTSDRIKNVIWLSTDLHAIIFSPISVDGLFTHSVPELVSGSIGENTLFRELPAGIKAALGGVPVLIVQVSEFDIDRYNAVMITIDPTVASPTAQFDFYDRTGAIVHSIGYTAAP